MFIHVYVLTCRHGHVCYRDSKLTRLLQKELTFIIPADKPQQSLDTAALLTSRNGTRSSMSNVDVPKFINTAVICLITPLARDMEDSLRTIRFGRHCRIRVWVEHRLSFLMFLYGSGFLSLRDKHPLMSVSASTLTSSSSGQVGAMIDIFCNTDLIRFIAKYL